eukprot:scaffold19375_cov103-Isochrysis_galbana.AAC.4
MPQVERCGPFSTFLKLRVRWNDGRTLTPSIRAKGAAAPRTFDEQVRSLWLAARVEAGREQSVTGLRPWPQR